MKKRPIICLNGAFLKTKMLSTTIAYFLLNSCISLIISFTSWFTCKKLEYKMRSRTSGSTAHNI